jgi:predicted nuclease of predicted toxin-antitoxin system
LRLDTASDRDIRAIARREGWTIVIKDRDFMQCAAAQSGPPKIIWIGLGNCTMREVETALRRNLHRIQEFDRDSNAFVLTITR